MTPDNRTLIIAASHGSCLTAFDIAADGSLSNRRVGANLGGDYPDGICLAPKAPPGTPTCPTSTVCESVMLGALAQQA